MPFHVERPGPGQESVWDYPRPPRVEAATQRVRVHFAGVELAASDRALRVLETSHPPVYYLPPEDIVPGVLVPTAQTSWCEWKGQATYYDVVVHDAVTGKVVAANAAWAYVQPVAAFARLRDHVAFYPHLMDACYVGDERVTPQPGSFYGGWITTDIVGPFKGGPGTVGW